MKHGIALGLGGNDRKQEYLLWYRPLTVHSHTPVTLVMLP